MIQLTWTEGLSIAIAAASLFGNLWQFLDARRMKAETLRPLSNSLLGIFNAIKQQNMVNYLVQTMVANPANPHEKVETLKWETAQLLQAIINSTTGLQEAVVSLLVTLNPDDPEGKRAFTAQRYGLTEEEIKIQKEFRETQVQNIRRSREAVQQQHQARQPGQYAPDRRDDGEEPPREEAPPVG